MPETLIRLYVGGTPATCRGCGAPILWFKTLAGKTMPMNISAQPRTVGAGTDGKAWTRYGIKVNNRWHGTFDLSHRDVAIEAQQARSLVVITYRDSQYGRDIVSLTEAIA